MEVSIRTRVVLHSLVNLSLVLMVLVGFFAPELTKIVINLKITWNIAECIHESPSNGVIQPFLFQ